MRRSSTFIQAFSGMFLVVFLGNTSALANEAQSLGEESLVVIPESTALTVVFPSQKVIELTEGNLENATLPLSQPILDSRGNVVALPGTDVQVTYNATDDGVSMKIESINLDGQYVALDTSSVSLGGVAVYQDARFRQGMNANSYIPGLTAGVFRLLSDDGDLMWPIAGLAIGEALRHLLDNSSPEVAIVTQVLPGTRQTLQLLSPLALSPSEDGNLVWSPLDTSSFEFYEIVSQELDVSS